MIMTVHNKMVDEHSTRFVCGAKVGKGNAEYHLTPHTIEGVRQRTRMLANSMLDAQEYNAPGVYSQ